MSPEVSLPALASPSGPGPEDQRFPVTTPRQFGRKRSARSSLSENRSVKVAQHSASLPGFARGGVLVASGIGCGVLLGLNDVTWALAAAAAAGLALALVRGVDVERAALTTAAMFVGVIGATAVLVWFGPWAWSTVPRSAAPVSAWTLQISVILVLFVVLFAVALFGTTTGLVVRRLFREFRRIR